MSFNNNAQHAVNLFPSAARIVTVTGDVAIITNANAIQFVLDVTAAATAVGDTLNVKVQTLLDLPGNDSATGFWVDIAAFTEVLGNGGAKRYFEKIVAGLAQAGFENGAALAAGDVRHLLGKKFRAVATVVDADTDDASFTFSVVAIPA